MPKALLAPYSALYSPLDIAYSQLMSGPYEDLSYRDEDCEIIAGLKDGRLSGFWRPMVAVGDEKALKVQIDRLWAVSQDWYYLDFLVDSELSVVSKFLLRQGYIARPVYTQIMDLMCLERLLYSELRKSYKQLVRQGYCKCASNGIAINILRTLRPSGRVIRPEKSWAIQRAMIDKAEAFLCFEITDERYTTAVLVYYNSHSAYYASAASAPDSNAHSALYSAICKSKELGCKTFELGEQVFSVDQIMMDGKPATEKHVNISHFKAGFGGNTVTRLILEKP